jgi:cell wall-associated NlpC family hydrolase
VSGSNSSEVRYIKGSSVRLRSGPSTSSGILSICNNGAQVKLNSVSNGWAYVTTSDGKTGYVAAAYLSYSPQSVSSAPAQSQQSWTGYIKGNNVRVRSGPSTSYSILTTLSNGTPVTVTSQDGSWDGVTVNGQSGYVSSVYISSTKPVVSASPAASSKGQQIANTAVQYVGYPYVYGGTDPSGFDCSGFVKYIFGLYGITTNRTAEDQARNGYAVDRSQLQPGDIICFSYGSGYIGHVGIYIGNGQFVHACNSYTGVIITDLNSSSYTNRVAACRRLV